MGSETGPIRGLHVGLGPIGAGVVRQVAERKGFRIVGRGGHRSGEGRARSRRGRRRRPRAARQGVGRREERRSRPPSRTSSSCARSSSLKKVLPQIEEILKLKVPIVSTTEELAYPTGAT